jgi:hypothetical protein
MTTTGTTKSTTIVKLIGNPMTSSRPLATIEYRDILHAKEGPNYDNKIFEKCMKGITRALY